MNVVTADGRKGQRGRRRIPSEACPARRSQRATRAASWETGGGVRVRRAFGVGVTKAAWLAHRVVCIVVDANVVRPRLLDVAAGFGAARDGLRGGEKRVRRGGGHATQGAPLASARKRATPTVSSSPRASSSKLMSRGDGANCERRGGAPGRVRLLRSPCLGRTVFADNLGVFKLGINVLVGHLGQRTVW